MVSPKSDARAMLPGSFGFALDPADLISGLERGLAVIESFDDECPRLTVAQVAARTGISRTAARRYLLNLCHLGYADTDGKLYWLAPRVLRLGQSYLGSARLPRLVQPFVQRLSMECGETVNVSVLDDHEVVYIARSNSPRVVSIGFHAGARVPVHVVSPGIVLLSTLSDEALEVWAGQHPFASFTPNTQVTPEAFVTQVRAARQQGYWISVGQLDSGLTGVATLLRDRRGEARAALGMTLQSAAWPQAQIEARLLPLLTNTAQILRDII